MLVENDKSDYVDQEKGTNSTIVHLTIHFGSKLAVTGVQDIVDEEAKVHQSHDYVW